MGQVRVIVLGCKSDCSSPLGEENFFDEPFRMRSAESKVKLDVFSLLICHS